MQHNFRYFNRLLWLSMVIFLTKTSQSFGQKVSEILGRPTDKSITVNLLFDNDVDAYCEWGIASGNYTQQTANQSFSKSIPVDVDFNNLSPNTKYFYRTRYKTAGMTTYLTGKEHYFNTQKPKGTPFNFIVQADPHMDENSDSLVYELCMKNQSLDKADFMVDLGDIFMSEKLPVINYNTIEERVLYMRSFYDLSCHSTPLLMAIGNHEGEWGYNLNGTENNITVWDTKLRKIHYPNPYPNSFYSGATIQYPFQGVRENYYAFEWGDALFVVLDPFYYTNKKQGNNSWNQTLGEKQYNWFRSTLENNKSKFKFVFSHNLVGGAPSMRGGIEFASLYEWGGLNADGTPGFANNRPGWYKPIHDIMVENNVSIYFHGHDHFYAKQDLDCIVYQLVPQPSYPGYTKNQAAEYGYLKGDFAANAGHLNISVNADSVKVDYVRTYLPKDENSVRKNRSISNSYVVKPCVISESNEIKLSNGSLGNNAPNPFQNKTNINFSITEKTKVSISIFDFNGKLVKKVIDNQEYTAGDYNVEWDATNQNGSQINPGVYFYSLQIEGQSLTKKMINVTY